MGRSSEYTQEIGEKICKAIASSSKGIKALCEDNPDFPHFDTVYKWIAENVPFSEMYSRAKKAQIQVFVDEIVQISDNASKDTMVNEKGKTVIDHENINRARLRVDTRKWLAAKLMPRMFGDKIKLDLPAGTELEVTTNRVKDADDQYTKEF